MYIKRICLVIFSGFFPTPWHAHPMHEISFEEAKKKTVKVYSYLQSDRKNRTTTLSLTLNLSLCSFIQNRTQSLWIGCIVARGAMIPFIHFRLWQLEEKIETNRRNFYTCYCLLLLLLLLLLLGVFHVALMFYYTNNENEQKTEEKSEQIVVNTQKWSIACDSQVVVLRRNFQVKYELRATDKQWRKTTKTLHPNVLIWYFAQRMHFFFMNFVWINIWSDMDFRIIQILIELQRCSHINGSERKKANDIRNDLFIWYFCRIPSLCSIINCCRIAMILWISLSVWTNLAVYIANSTKMLKF